MSNKNEHGDNDRIVIMTKVTFHALQKYSIKRMTGSSDSLINSGAARISSFFGGGDMCSEAFHGGPLLT